MSSKKQKNSIPKPLVPEVSFLQEIKSLVIIVLIALGLRATVVVSDIVPTGSMEKTIIVGEESYVVRDPRRIEDGMLTRIELSEA